jgi:hypothetical protein
MVFSFYFLRFGLTSVFPLSLDAVCFLALSCSIFCSSRSLRNSSSDVDSQEE